MKPREADVLFAASETDMNLFWATRFAAPDPFAFFRVGGRKYLVASDLEIGRAREQAKVHHVLSMSRVGARLRRRGISKPDATDILVGVLLEKNVARARVPRDFPIYTADRLRESGIEVVPVAAPFWPDRARKTDEEITAIREAAVRTGEAVACGIERIRRSKPVRGYLRADGHPLTSEEVRATIDRALLDRGMVGQKTIVAGGEQAVDPHNGGEGPLRSGYPVIIDCFPRSVETGYHADITRTVFRGRPTKEQRLMWDAVQSAFDLGVELARAGAIGREVHERVQESFRSAGYETGPTGDGKMCGFFHGTGHGLGLDVHEPPLYSRSDDPLKEGMVITVEPGLYYPGVGGIRIEDDVVVRSEGSENLVPLETTFVV